MEYEMKSGVYLIINTANGHEYVGSSKDLARRKKEHFNKLRLGKHPNIKLQRAYNNHGETVFEFRVLVICDMDQAFEVEQAWLDIHKPFYNISLKVEQPQAPTRKVRQYSIQGDFIKEFDSLQEASLSVGGDRSSLAKACLKKLHTHRGFVWKYADEVQSETIEPSKSCNRGGIRWFEFWNSGKYTIYKWTKTGELVETFRDIHKLTADLGVTVNRLTCHFRGVGKTFKGYKYTFKADSDNGN